MEKGWQPQAQLGDGREYQRPAKHVQKRFLDSASLEMTQISALIIHNWYNEKKRFAGGSARMV
ncbi:MAG TPA: hypothetical protein DIU00_17640 [Phycisphaerales bacterium]|nr:hypothetical protein [Phycisphaerales bacterium]